MASQRPRSSREWSRASGEPSGRAPRRPHSGGPARGPVPEGRADLLLQHVERQVADDSHRGVLRPVPAVVEGLQAGGRQARDAVPGSQRAAGAGAQGAILEGVHPLTQHPQDIRPSHPFLFDDLALVRQVRLGESQAVGDVAQPPGRHVHLAGVGARQVELVDGLLEVTGRVAVGPEGDVQRREDQVELVRWEGPRAVEGKVLDKMCRAPLVLGLVEAADGDAEAQGDAALGRRVALDGVA
jgi:hypothetical protein